MTTSRPWTISEAVYMASHAPHKSPTQLSHALGRTKSSVRSFAWRRRVATRDARRRLFAAYGRLLEQGVWGSPRVHDCGRIVALPVDFESFVTWSTWNGYHPSARPVLDRETNAWRWTREPA